MGYWIPDPRWELWELMEGRKPTEPVEIDINLSDGIYHYYLPFENSPDVIYDLFGIADLDHADGLINTDQGIAAKFINTTIGDNIPVLLPNTWTVIARVRTNTLSDHWYGFGLDDAVGGEFINVGYDNASSKWKVYSNGRTPGSATIAPVLNEFETVALSWNGAQFLLHINGVFNYSVTPSTSVWIADLDTLVLGDTLESSALNSFSGAILWSTLSCLLTDSEISAIHDKPFQFLIPKVS